MSGFATIKSSIAGSGGSSNDTTNAAGQTSFGEVSVAEPTMRSFGTFVHGINPALFTTSSNGAGSSVTTANGSAVLKTGTSTTGSVSVRLTRGNAYRPGIGSMCRFTTIFGTPTVGTSQVAGFGNPESGYYFGYSGTNFGIFHISNSVREIWAHNIIAGVANGTSVTITLDGASKTFTCNGGSNVNQTSHEIAKQDFSDVARGWNAESHDGTVYFISNRAGVVSNTVTSSIATSTITKYKAGENVTSSFITQSAWNIDTMDGNGPSRMVLDTTKGNVYQVGMQYLGFGNGLFSIENPATGQFQRVHAIRNANARTSPVFRDPHFFGRWAITNAGSAVGTYMSGTSIATYAEGKVIQNVGIAHSISGSKASVTAEVPLLTIRSNRVFNGQAIYGEVILSSLSAIMITGGATTRSGTIRFYKNALLTGPVNYQYVNSTRSIVSYDTAATGFSLDDGRLIAIYKIPSETLLERNLLDEDFFLSPGETLTITCDATNSSTIDVSLNWFEDQ